MVFLCIDVTLNMLVKEDDSVNFGRVTKNIIWWYSFAYTCTFITLSRLIAVRETGVSRLLDFLGSCSCPRDSPLSASWGPIEGPLKPPVHHSTIILRVPYP